MATDEKKQERETDSGSDENQGVLTDAGENGYTFDGYKIILNKKITLVPKTKSKK